MQWDNACSLVSTLLPAETINTLLTTPRQKIAFALLALNNCSKALTSLKEKKLTKLDALAGDFGCQLQALTIYHLATSDTVQEEVEKLDTKIDALKIDLKKVRAQQKNQSQEIDRLLKELDGILLSAEISYLVRAHLLTVTKIYIKKEDGYFDDRTETSRIATS